MVADLAHQSEPNPFNAKLLKSACSYVEKLPLFGGENKHKMRQSGIIHSFVLALLNEKISPLILLDEQKSTSSNFLEVLSWPLFIFNEALTVNCVRRIYV